MSGHLFLSAKDTIDKCYELLNRDCDQEIVSKQDIEKALSAERAESRVYLEGTRVYLSYERGTQDSQTGLTQLVMKHRCEGRRTYV